LKGRGSKQTWPNEKYCADICPPAQKIPVARSELAPFHVQDSTFGLQSAGSPLTTSCWQSQLVTYENYVSSVPGSRRTTWIPNSYLSTC